MTKYENRSHWFSYLSNLSFRVPIHGVCSEIASQLSEDAYVRVFDDEIPKNEDDLFDHSSGRFAMSLKEALSIFPNLHVEHLVVKSFSSSFITKFIQLGNKYYEIETELNPFSWGYRKEEVLLKSSGEGVKYPQIKYRIFSMEFALVNSKAYVINFERRPSFKKSLIHRLIDRKQIKNALIDEEKMFEPIEEKHLGDI